MCLCGCLHAWWTERERKRERSLRAARLRKIQSVVCEIKKPWTLCQREKKCSVPHRKPQNENESKRERAEKNHTQNDQMICDEGTIMCESQRHPWFIWSWTDEWMAAKYARILLWFPYNTKRKMWYWRKIHITCTAIRDCVVSLSWHGISTRKIIDKDNVNGSQSTTWMNSVLYFFLNALLSVYCALCMCGLCMACE